MLAAYTSYFTLLRQVVGHYILDVYCLALVFFCVWVHKAWLPCSVLQVGTNPGGKPVRNEDYKSEVLHTYLQKSLPLKKA